MKNVRVNYSQWRKVYSKPDGKGGLTTQPEEDIEFSATIGFVYKEDDPMAKRVIELLIELQKLAGVGVPN